MVDDVERAKRFYRAVFGWQFSDTPGYTFVDPGDGVRGGMMAKPAKVPMPALNVYFRVDDIAKSLRDVVESGGTVLAPPMEIPGVGTFAVFADPDQIPIGILQLVAT